VATQYPLQSKAFIWPLSARYMLSRIPHSALYIRASVPATPFPTIVGDDKTSNHLPCSQISMRVTEHAFECFNLAKLTLFNLNIHCSNTHPTAAANDTAFNLMQRKAA
jgi:hypothetical protein